MSGANRSSHHLTKPSHGSRNYSGKPTRTLLSHLPATRLTWWRIILISGQLQRRMQKLMQEKPGSYSSKLRRRLPRMSKTFSRLLHENFLSNKRDHVVSDRIRAQVSTCVPNLHLKVREVATVKRRLGFLLNNVSIHCVRYIPCSMHAFSAF